MPSSSFHNSVNQRKLRAVVGHNGRKGVELFHAIGTFLINNVNTCFEHVFFKANTGMFS